MNIPLAPAPELLLRGTSLVQFCTLPSVTIVGWALSQLGCEVLGVRLSTGGSFLLIDAVAELQLNEAGIALPELEHRARGLVRVADDAQPETGGLTDAAMSALAGLSAFQVTRPGQPSPCEFPVLGTFTGLLAAVAVTAQMAEDTPSRPTESITLSRASVAALLTGLVGTTSVQPRPGSAAVQVGDPKGQNPAYRVYETPMDGFV